MKGVACELSVLDFNYHSKRFTSTVGFYGFAWFRVGFSWIQVGFQDFSWIQVGFSCFQVGIYCLYCSSFFCGFHGARLVFHCSRSVFMVFRVFMVPGWFFIFHVENTLKQYSCPTIQSRPCQVGF